MISSIFAAIDIYRNRVAYDRIQAGKMVERELDDRPERGSYRGPHQSYQAEEMSDPDVDLKEE